MESVPDAPRDMNLRLFPSMLTALLSGSLAVSAADPWPAETNTVAVQVTGIDPGLNASNWSGAFWNPDTRMLWLANNSGYFWALVEGGPLGMQVATNAAGTPAKWTSSGDFEGICQTDSDTNLVYVMDENGYIREYDIRTHGVINETHVWDIRTQCPEAGGSSGGEGLAFIPDEYLRRQHFCQTNGAPYASTNGMGGLMFVGYQADGYVHAFDLNRTHNSYGYVGRYKTGQSETADLAFDRATGQLYIWHNPSNINYLEVVELNSYVEGSVRRLRPLAEYLGPRNGNLEGFALVPAASTNDRGGCIVTDDNNLPAGEAVVWYREFRPAEDTDADGLADGVELWHFGSTTQTVGSADSDGDRIANAAEILAGTDPTNSSSVLIQLAPIANGQELVLSWQSATGRTYAIRSAANPTNGYRHVVQAGISNTAPINVVTLGVAGLASNTFFQIVVGAP